MYLDKEASNSLVSFGHKVYVEDEIAGNQITLIGPWWKKIYVMLKSLEFDPSTVFMAIKQYDSEYRGCWFGE